MKSIAINVLVILFLSLPMPALSQESADHEVRVMSFNIRYGTAKDGDNHWSQRKQTVAQAIIDTNPDVVGTQETIGFQADYLKKQLAAYTYAGRSRDANPEEGEQCGIFFKSKRFTKLVEGHFWLSQNPDKPGSKSWDSSLPRMATWLKLWDRQSGRSLYVINTHFDHRGKTARLESAKLLRRFVNDLPDAKYVIVTGDFNARETAPPYRELFATATPELPTAIRDTFRIHNPKPTKTEGTFGGFKGKTGGARIDWIGCTSAFDIKRAGIIRKSYDGKDPSDHFPVFAELKYRK